MIVEIEAWMADLVPRFLLHRKQELERVETAYSKSDFKDLRFVGHNLRGSAGGYGFSDLADAGAALENAAQAEDREAARAAIDRIASYLRSVEVVYRDG